MCISGSESPVVVVLTGSMEPGFKRVSSFYMVTISTFKAFSSFTSLTTVSPLFVCVLSFLCLT